VIAGVLITVAMALAACGSGGGSQPTPTPTGDGASTSAHPPVSATPTPTSPVDTARRDASAAYLGMWQKYAQASHTSDWRAPYLSQYASGDALQFLSRDLYADHYNGLISKGDPGNSPHVTSVSPEDAPTSAMISDCLDDLAIPTPSSPAPGTARIFPPAAREPGRSLGPAPAPARPRRGEPRGVVGPVAMPAA